MYRMNCMAVCLVVGMECELGVHACPCVHGRTTRCACAHSILAHDQHGSMHEGHDRQVLAGEVLTWTCIRWHQDERR